MKNMLKGLLLAAGVALVAGCATPMPLDPNAQVPPPNNPAPVKSSTEMP